MMICCLILDPSPVEMEETGLLWQAGAAWQEEGSSGGQARVLCRLLEEALYAGHANRAEWLIEDLEAFPLEPGLEDYWYGRLAWCCGLDSMAIRELTEVTGSQWLEHRASGTALLYMGRPEDAVAEFRASLASATTRRRQYWSALDLSFALVQAGRCEEANEVCALLDSAYAGDGMHRIVRALALYGDGGVTEAMVTLSDLAGSGDAATADMARALLEDLE
jgi:hypothetical protein